MAGLVDPTVTGNYPVILGDGLLGKTSNDIFTGIKYNHKPEHSSSTAPEQARLKPAVAGKTTSYDLSYNDNGTYAFAGTRNIDSNQFVLHFDPKRKAFILDRIDSTFNMNLTRTPTNSDPENLRRTYPHIEDETKPKPKATPAAPQKGKTTKAKAKAASNVFNKPPPKPARSKTEKKQVKDVPLSLPKPEVAQPPEPKRKSRKDEDDEDEEEDEGPDPLEVDWGSPKANKADFSPAFNAVAPRRFDDYMNQRDSEADEADEDSEGPLDNDFKLPSPVKSRAAQPQPDDDDAMEVDDRAQEEDDDMGASLEDDLEKELENAFDDLENSQNGTPDAGDESEISEED
ncbi:hypothetical protein NLU13_4171 [Sarocladium strictum]|uniref:Transcription elongation factor Eaf N-terminal domain-containing protein n=1 Tax=Sarocladium strictum TaxID=5046 RepID=A0AA39GJ05_SARSR|nr:hypothetical protein NLU13_4171 [Sarocladium strictum]